MAIAIDATSSSVAGPPTLTFSHTITSGTSRMLLVMVVVSAAITANLVITGVTYNGAALTVMSTQNDSDGILGVSVWYMSDPSLAAAGAHNIVVSGNASAFTLKAYAMSFTGVANGAPEASNKTNGPPNGTSISTNVTTIATNSLLVDVLGTESAVTTTCGGTQTQQFQDQTGSKTIGVSIRQATTPGSYAMSWSTSSTWSGEDQVVVSLAPFGGATSSDNALYCSEF